MLGCCGSGVGAVCLLNFWSFYLRVDVCSRVRFVFVCSCSVGFCVGFALMLSSWLCGVLKVLMLFFSPPFHCFVFVPPPNFCLHTSCLGAGTLFNPSSLPPRSHLFPLLPPPRPLTDPLPPSSAGTPCRTVWRRSIRQSNPESLPSGHSGDRWVTGGKGWGARRPHWHLHIILCYWFCKTVNFIDD